MAGDWLKVETALPDKPEVHYIASTLNIDPDAVIGKLLRVWSWFDQHTEDGNAVGVTFALVDRFAGVTGFGEAMQFAGWLVQKDKTLVMVNFDRHNSKSAKKRALSGERQARFRNASVTLGALPEKRREEKNKYIAIRPESVNPETWGSFLELRKAKKSPVTETALKGIASEAEKAGLSLEAALRECCARGWLGFKAAWMPAKESSEVRRVAI